MFGMKRKIICFLLSIFVATEILGCRLDASAKDFTFTDLSDFGISSLGVYRAPSVSIDGTVSPSEYGSGTSFLDGSGLYLLKSDAYSDAVRPSSATVQESYVALSGEYVYCALRLRSGDGAPIPLNKEFGPCYRVSISLSLSEGEHPALRGSALTNDYYFSAEDHTCISFYGDRIARSLTEKAVSAKPLSSMTEKYRENGLVTSDGVLWNAAQYCNNTCFSLENVGGVSTLTFEAKIPLEDVLLSVHPTERDKIRIAVKSASRTLCGSFSSQIYLSERTCLITGLPSSVSFSDETLASFMERDYEKPASGLYIPKIIPVPLYWCGQPPVKERVPVSKETQNVPSSEGISSTEKASFDDSTVQNESVMNSQTSDDPSSGTAVQENDESVFESLPDGDDLLPEETQIIYDTKTTTTTKKKNDNSLASSILATLTGAFLFGAVLILCIYFRDSGKREDEKNRKGKKKNQKEKRSDKRKD